MYSQVEPLPMELPSGKHAVRFPRIFPALFLHDLLNFRPVSLEHRIASRVLARSSRATDRRSVRAKGALNQFAQMPSNPERTRLQSLGFGRMCP